MSFVLSFLGYYKGRFDADHLQIPVEGIVWEAYDCHLHILNYKKGKFQRIKRPHTYNINKKDLQAHLKNFNHRIKFIKGKLVDDNQWPFWKGDK